MNTKIIFENNVAKVSIDNKTFPFVGYRSFHPKKEFVKQFGDIDFKFFNLFPSGIMTSLKNGTVPYSQYGPVWIGEDEYNWDNFKKQTDVFCENAPEGYVVLMLHLDPPEWFWKKYDDVEDTWACFINGADSDRWKTEALKYVKSVMKKAEELMPGRVYAYHLMCGGTTEWYTRDLKKALNNPSELHINSYKKWCNDNNAQIPDFESFCSTTDGVLTKDKNIVRYKRFLSEKTAETALYFADKVKEFCNNQKIVSSFFGYLGLDLSNTVKDGACDALRVYKSNSINMIACPASYNFRKRYSTSSFRIPVDSLTLHNMLYIHEIDAHTHVLKKNNIEPIHAAEVDDSFETVEQTSSYLKREIGMTLAKGQGYWLFDMMGGWYNDDEMIAEVNKLKKLSYANAEKNNERIAEVAVFVDAESNYYIGESSKYPEMELQMRDLNLAGYPWDMYLTDDLCEDKFDFDRYKLFIFPNLFSVRSHIADKIKELRSRGKNILFMHAPGYITHFDNLKELTGMDLCNTSLDSALSKLDDGTNVDFSVESTVWGVNWGEEYENSNFKPYYFINDKCTELAHFAEGGKPSIGIKWRENGGFDAYSAISPVNNSVLEYVANEAGVFSYVDRGNVIYANSSIITLYSFKKQNMNLRWKKKVKIKEFFTGEEYSIDKHGTDIPFEEYQTKIFFTEEM